jgi:hypothetical protein
MRGSLDKNNGVPTLQADATLDQAAPVQNTYYTVLDTKKNVRIISAALVALGVAETVQLRFTIDGITHESEVSDGVLAWQTAHLVRHTTTLFKLYQADPTSKNVPFLIEARSVKIEARKTTANGAGNLQGKVKWQYLS